MLNAFMVKVRPSKIIVFVFAVFVLAHAVMPAFAQDAPLFAPPSPAGVPDRLDPNLRNDTPSTNSLPPGPGFAFGDDESFDFEKSEEELEEDARKEAFDAALEGILPLRPEEIRKLLERFDQTQESVQIPVYPNPKPEFTVQTIPLDPGTQPVSVKVAYGHVTTINIVDTSGAPWPIEDITWAGNFEVIEANSGGASHVVRVSPQSEFAYGNMSMRLLGLQTPIVLTLESSRDIVHYRFDAIIPDYGPFGKAPIIQTGVNTVAGDKDLTSVLEGIIPPGAERLDVNGADSRTSAYNYNGMTYLRTPLTLLSPGWESSVSSADGTRVYAFQESPVVLLSDAGKMIRARLSSRGDVFDE
ncbi:MAG: DotH/IcmK family type IV secretion protein [Bdellovibrionales bacterium]